MYKFLILALILMSSLTAFAQKNSSNTEAREDWEKLMKSNDNFPLSAIKVLEKVTVSEELLACKNQIRAVRALTNSCSNFISLVLKKMNSVENKIWDKEFTILHLEVANSHAISKMYFDDETDLRERALGIADDLKDLTAHARSIYHE